VHRRTLILGLVAISCATARRAAAWTLITPEEAARDQAAPHIAPSFAALPPGGPTIEVEQPDPNKPITPPVTIRLRFVPQGTATIDIGSFRVLYGWLQIPITDRILQHAQVTQTGLVATDADIPPGKYSIRIEIADNLHRVGARDFAFTVE
jgi:hypothetical protein